MNKWMRIMTIALLVGTVFLGPAAQAQYQDVHFRWSASVNSVSGERYPLDELTYQVFLQRGAEPEEFVATIRDTTFMLSAEPGVVQRIRVTAVDRGGLESPASPWSDPIFFQEGGDPSPVPSAAELRDNYPNPFNPQTSIVYGVPVEVPSGVPFRLDIYTVQGQLVRHLEVDRSPGWHEVIWDGTNENGLVAAAGLYVTRFMVGTMVESKKMTLLK